MEKNMHKLSTLDILELSKIIAKGKESIINDLTKQIDFCSVVTEKLQEKGIPSSYGLQEFELFLQFNIALLKYLKTGKEKDIILELCTKFRKYIDVASDEMIFPEKDNQGFMLYDEKSDTIVKNEEAIRLKVNSFKTNYENMRSDCKLIFKIRKELDLRLK